MGSRLRGCFTVLCARIRSVLRTLLNANLSTKSAERNSVVISDRMENTRRLVVTDDAGGNDRDTSPDYPLVSVVMPTLNQCQFIEASVRSILTQSYANLELIIADGGSTDGTQNLLRELSQQDERIRWFSENDNGPSQALNRALSRVRGTLIGWLNSDDLYASDAIVRAVDVFDNAPDCLMVYGEGVHIDVSGKLLNRYPTLPPSRSVSRFKDGCFICQPTVFFRRSLYIMLGPLDESLKTAFDFDYWIRVFRAFPQRISFVRHFQAKSRLHDQCITLKQRKKVMLEGMQVLARYFGTAPAHWVLTYFNDIRTPDHDTWAASARIFLEEAKPYLSNADQDELLLLVNQAGS